MHMAASLPREFAAPHRSNVQRIDLSKLARAPGTSEVIRPGDVLDVLIMTGLEERAVEPVPTRVAEDGTLQIPLVGSVAVAGLELSQAEQVVHDESVQRGFYKAPQVALMMKARRTNLVTVVGAVESPGLKELTASQSDLLSALVAAGGLSKDASSIIEVRHPSEDGDPARHAAGELALASRAEGPANTRGSSFATAHRTTQIDLENPPANSGRAFDLRDGSVVMVMKRPDEYVHVMGLVKKADQFKLPDDQELRLLDAIAMAGGRSIEIADKVRIIRRAGNPDAPPILIQASVREAKQDASANLRLASGDVVSIEETPTTFVVGTIREFVRFGFTSAIPGL